MLRRILRHFVWMDLGQRGLVFGWHAASDPTGQVKVSIPHLEVMALGDGGAMTKPSGRNVGWEPFDQFRLARRQQVLEQAGPSLQPCPCDDLRKRGPQIHCRVAIASDHMLGPRLGSVKCREQQRIVHDCPQTEAEMQLLMQAAVDEAKKDATSVEVQTHRDYGFQD